jgi:hypothetical protein
MVRSELGLQGQSINRWQSENDLERLDRIGDDNPPSSGGQDVNDTKQNTWPFDDRLTWAHISPRMATQIDTIKLQDWELVCSSSTGSPLSLESLWTSTKQEIMLCILMSTLKLVLIYGGTDTDAWGNTYLRHKSSPQQNGYVLAPYRNARSQQRTSMYPVRVCNLLSLFVRAYKEAYYLAFH